MNWPRSKTNPNVFPLWRIIWNLIWGVPALAILSVACLLVSVQTMSASTGRAMWRAAR